MISLGFRWTDCGKNMLNKDFKQTLVDRFESWELAEFLQISTEDFVEMFEDEIEMNYEDVAEFVGLREEENFDEVGTYS